MSVQNPKYTLFLLILVLCPLWASAQILDDSTKLVYGPRTTTYITEKDLLYNAEKVYYPDTVLTHFHRFTEPERLRYQYQNLGNLGTALSPVYFESPEIIGARTGFYVYDRWFNDPEDIKYFNTRSPYTKLTYFQGGNRRSLLDVTHSRNVNPQWNFGLDFRRLSAQKQIGPATAPNDRQSVSTAYDIFTHYKTKDGRYHVMGNISRVRHFVYESGGIELPPPLPPGPDGVVPPQREATEYIRYENSNVRITGATSEFFRINYHIFHQFKINELATVYHRFDRQRQENAFIHEPLTTDLDYYHQILISEDSTADRFEQKFWQNELGLKGGAGKLSYGLYLKRKTIDFMPRYLLPVEVKEDYAGFNLRLAADSTLQIAAEGEYLWPDFYKVQASVRLKWLEGSIKRQRYKPAFIQENYFGNHGEWHNDFIAPVSNELRASLTLPFDRLWLKTGFRASLIQNHIYFTADTLDGRTRPLNVRPEQAGASAQILSPFARVKWEIIPRFFWENEITLSKVTGKSAHVFNVPEWLYNTSFYYEGEMFGGNLHGQLGVDAHMKAPYFANAYDPVTQQFLLQDDFLVPSYPIVDLFFGFRIARTRVFLRMSNLAQGLYERGYFITPYYSGTERTFDLGIDWLFFD